MHDTIICRDILDAAKAHGEVIGITVEVGDLGHVPLPELEETLKKLVPGWKVRLVRKKAKVKCRCGYVGEPTIAEHSHGHAIFFCKKCKGVPELLEGQDIILKEVEIK